MLPRVLIFSTSNYLSGIKVHLFSDEISLVEAHDADSLLLRASQESYDLFVLDSNSENELFRISEKIRASTPNMRSPILYVSTKGISLERAFAGYEAAPILSVVKPFSPKDLTNSVRLLIGFKVQRDELIEKNWRLEQAIRENEEKAKVIEEQRAQLFHQANLSSLGEMAGGVAHEINTPLAVIGMKVEQMEEWLKKGDLDEIDFADGLQVIKETTERIAKIVNGLCFFAREGRRDSPQRVKVCELLDGTMDLCQERFSNHGVQLQVERDAAYSLLEVECRAVEISQVILNLLNNAYDAIEFLKEKWVRIQVRDLGMHVELAITDSGPGIPKHVQEKMMQPFFTTKEIGKGTGLGLSISKGIIESHHGKLYLEEMSPHTKFVILVPKQHINTANARANLNHGI